MGVLDKIKNALFEVEYVEVEDVPKKEKKFKSKDKKHDEDKDKPIAKKIVLPGKDEDFEIHPKDERVKEVFDDNFNVMEDDFTPETTPEVVQPVVEVAPATNPEPVPETTHVESPIRPTYQENAYANKDYVREYDSNKEKIYSTLRDEYRVKAHESKPYGIDTSYHVEIKEYGSINKDDKNYFKPSPIISPIYGILDKNYRKEDVVSKKEIHITSSYAKSNMNVDDIRNKAYGRRSTEPVEEVTTPPETPKTLPPAFEVEEEDENLLVDLTDEKKPEVKEITVGDAIEYYHDLGLEYNVDYVDASNKNQPKKNQDDLEEEIKETIDSSPEVADEPVIERTMEIPQEDIKNQEEEKVVETQEELEEEPKVEEKEESSDDDNLFDLIDSMYKDDEN